MKICSQCKILKDCNEFSCRAESPHLFRSKCRKCESENWKVWYSKNKSKRIEYCIAHTKKNRKALIEWMNSIKSAPCTDCGHKYNPWVMDFDHLDSSEKTMNISIMVRRNWSRKKISQEIQKCELVCANCHREREWKRYNNKNV